MDIQHEKIFCPYCRAEVFMLPFHLKCFLTHMSYINSSSYYLDIINEIDAQQLNLETGKYVLLSIIDTGCGMDSETKEKIFKYNFVKCFKGKIWI